MAKPPQVNGLPRLAAERLSLMCACDAHKTKTAQLLGILILDNVTTQPANGGTLANYSMEGWLITS